MHFFSEKVSSKNIRKILGVFLILLFFILVNQTRVTFKHGSDSDVDAQYFLYSIRYNETGFLESKYITPSSCYPPLSEIINVLYLKLGITSFRACKILAVFFSVFSLWLMFTFISMLVSERTALFAVIFTGTNIIFLRYADSIYRHSYEYFFLFSSLILLIHACRKNSLKLTFFSSVFCFLCCYVSIEYHLFFFFFSIAFYIWERPVKGLRHIILLNTSIAVSFAVYSLHNIWYFGSTSLFVKYLYEKVLYRSGFSYGFLELTKRSLENLVNRFNIYSYGFTAFILLIPFCIVLNQKNISKLKTSLFYTAAFLADPLVWQLVIFRQHSLPEYHSEMFRQFLPGIALLTGFFADSCWSFINELKDKHLIRRIFVFSLGIMAFFYFQMGIRYMLTVAYPWRIADKWETWNQNKSLLEHKNILFSDPWSELGFLVHTEFKSNYFYLNSCETAFLDTLQEKIHSGKYDVFYNFYKNYDNQPKDPQLLKSTADILSGYKKITVSDGEIYFLNESNAEEQEN